MPDPSTPPPPPSTDEALVDQLRAWADDLASQVGPVASPSARPTRGPRRALAVAAVLLLLAGGAIVLRAALADDGETTVAGPSSDAGADDVPAAGVGTIDAVYGDPWTLVAVTRAGEAVAVPADLGASVTFSPQGGDCVVLPQETEPVCEDGPSIQATDGCGGWVAELVVEGDVLRTRGEVGSLAACTRPGREAAAVVNEVLRQSVTFGVAGDRLALHGRAGVLLYERQEAGLPDAAFDVTWEVVAIVDGRGPVTEPASDSFGPSTLRFEHVPCEPGDDDCTSDDVVSGRVECNSYSARITLTSEGFAADRYGQTEAGCRGEDGGSSLLPGVLIGSPEVTYAPGRLVLVEGDVEVTLEPADDYGPTDDEVLDVGADPAYRVRVKVGEGGRLVRVTLERPATGSTVVSDRYATDGAALRGQAFRVVPVGAGYVAVGAVPPGASVAVVDAGGETVVPVRPIAAAPDLAVASGPLREPPTAACTVVTTAADGTVLGTVAC